MSKSKSEDKSTQVEKPKTADGGRSIAPPAEEPAPIEKQEAKPAEKSPTTYFVKLEGPDKWAAHRVTAASKEEAIEAYMKMVGITSTIHNFACDPCDPE